MSCATVYEKLEALVLIIQVFSLVSLGNCAVKTTTYDAWAFQKAIELRPVLKISGSEVITKTNSTKAGNMINSFEKKGIKIFDDTTNIDVAKKVIPGNEHITKKKVADWVTEILPHIIAIPVDITGFKVECFEEELKTPRSKSNPLPDRLFYLLLPWYTIPKSDTEESSQHAVIPNGDEDDKMANAVSRKRTRGTLDGGPSKAMKSGGSPQWPVSSKNGVKTQIVDREVVKIPTSTQSESVICPTGAQPSQTLVSVGDAQNAWDTFLPKDNSRSNKEDFQSNLLKALALFFQVGDEPLKFLVLGNAAQNVAEKGTAAGTYLRFETGIIPVGTNYGQALNYLNLRFEYSGVDNGKSKGATLGSDEIDWTVKYVRQAEAAVTTLKAQHLVEQHDKIVPYIRLQTEVMGELDSLKEVLTLGKLTAEKFMDGAYEQITVDDALTGKLTDVGIMMLRKGSQEEAKEYKMEIFLYEGQVEDEYTITMYPCDYNNKELPIEGSWNWRD